MQYGPLDPIPPCAFPTLLCAIVILVITSCVSLACWGYDRSRGIGQLTGYYVIICRSRKEVAFSNKQKRHILCIHLSKQE